MDQSTAPNPTFADQLRHLLEVRLHPSGRPYRYHEVAMALRAYPGRKSGRSYVRALATGEIEDPGRSTISGLCRFFKVSPSYFFPELADYQFLPLPDKEPLSE